MRDRSELGAAAVEFAIVGSIATIMLLAVLDFGYAFYTRQLITDLARVGVRYAMVRGSGCTYSGCPATAASIQTQVRSEAAGVNAAYLTVSTTWSTSSSCTASTSPYNSAGCVVSVTVQYPYTFFVPLFGAQLAPMSSTAQAVMTQ